MTDKQQIRLRTLATEKARRQCEALRIFRPLQSQMKIFTSLASEMLVRGGNRCLGGEQEIYDPVSDTTTRVDEIGRDFHVHSVNAASGDLEIKPACYPFIKASEKLYRFTLSNGETLVATMNHRVLTAENQWLPLSACVAHHTSDGDHRESVAVPLRSSWGNGPGGFPRDDHDSTHTASDWRGSYWPGHYRYDERLPPEPIFFPGPPPSPADVSGHTRHYYDAGVVTHNAVRTPTCQSWFLPSTPGADLPTWAQCDASESRCELQTYSPPFGGHPVYQRFPEASSHHLRTTAVPAPRAASRSGSTSGFSGGGGSGQKTLIITAVEFLRKGSVYDFAVKDNANYISAGLLNHNSGKTTCTAAEIASAATGIPITGADGAEIAFKYPRNRPLSIWLIGYGAKHVGDTFHRILFRRNPEFKTLRDEETGEWRAYDPVRDAHRKDTRPAPPFIPRRAIQGFGWEVFSKRHFNICRLKPRPEFGDQHGTEIRAYTSIGEPKMGDPVDVIWIDERIKFVHHYAEWQARISDRAGRIIWSLTPEYNSTKVSEIIKRAKADEELDNPDVEQVQLIFSKNPYIAPEQIRKRLKGWSEEERQLRDRGELVSGWARMYPNFSAFLHCTPASDKVMDDKIDAALRKNGLEPPDDWCRELILDPGHTHPGVLFCAIPPPELGEGGVVYDELYLPQHDAKMLAKKVQEKVSGKAFNRFIVDFRAGRQTQGGATLSIKDQYVEAFKKLRIVCETSGSHFMWSSDNLEADCSLVRDRLAIQHSGKPWLRVVVDKCPNFVTMMEDYHKAQDAQGFVQEKPAPNQIDPLCDCVRYWVASWPKYAKPRTSGKAPSWQRVYFDEVWSKPMDGKRKDQSIYLGAGVAASHMH